MVHGLSKRERICSVKAVETLVSSGRYLSNGPVRCCFLQRKPVENSDEEEKGLNRILVSVPKKFFKRAVKRNLLKRRIREAYRLQKELLTAGAVDMMFVFTSKDEAGFAVIYDAVGTILKNIDARLAEHGDGNAEN
ncbi:MAG: ribonuclease P protein component [Bacteroidales bacterium]|nr:ribonuclease P protein component [Bacteroidales bacterium]